jgi:hypothetical protein
VGTIGRDAIRALTLSVSVASLACSGSSGTAPTPPGSTPSTNVTGTWTGSASDSSGPGQMTWQITQSGSSFSGNVSMIDTSTKVAGRGTVSGTVSGSAIQFSLAVPAGGFDTPYAACTADVSGNGSASSTSITGGYSGSSSCGGAVVSGQLTLNKQ